MTINRSRKAPDWGFLRYFCLWLACSLGAVALAGPPSPPAAGLASAHPLATAAGHEMLTAGGNAFDAAVAVAATLAVVEPSGSGLGGGGFFLLHRSRDDLTTMVDARERAPLAATHDMYLDAAGEVVPGQSLNGPLAAGIPGLPAALVHIAAHYGELSLAQSLAPAIRHAREGFPADAHYRRMLGLRRQAMLASPAAARVFLQAGEVPPEGASIRQPDLAATLSRLARDGQPGFYRGEIAQRLVDGVRAAGGIWQLRDLHDYQVVEREPVRAQWQGLTVTSAAPPSSGGVVLVEMLNMLAGADLASMDVVARTHLLVEVMRRAYRDRARYLGDPDVVDMPLAQLLHPYYAAGLAADINPHRATPSSDLPGIIDTQAAGADTSHFSILDEEGNRVAATLSINYPFGAAFMPPGTGVLLNDEMDDFSLRPGTPNGYGLIGAEANAIAPGKRMLSSMAPTFVESESGVAIIGTPGGSRIITMVLHAILAWNEGQTAQEIVSQPRFHHQYLPDVIQLEPNTLSEDAQASLQQLGHTLKPRDRQYGNMQVVLWDKQTGQVTAASDPRGIGSAQVSSVVTPRE